MDDRTGENRHARQAVVRRSLTWRTGAWPLVWLAWVCLSGCKIGPHYTGPSLDRLPATFRSAGPLDPAEPAALDCWWTNFNDPTLTELITVAARRNLDLREAYYRIVESRAAANVVKGNLFPKISANGLDAYRKSSNNSREFVPIGAASRAYDVFSLGFDSTWEIDVFGRLRRAVEAAKDDLQSVEFARDAVQVSLLADVATHYVNLRVTQRRIQIARQNLELQTKTLNVIERRTAAGLNGQLDRAQAAANRHKTAAAIPLLEQQQQVAFNRLCVLLGEAPTDEIVAYVGEAPIPQFTNNLTTGLPGDLLRRRPDIAEAERQLAAATARIGVAKGDLYPQFTITGNVSVDSRELANLFSSPSISHNLGPSLRWNVLSFGRVLNNIKVQEARCEQARVRLQERTLVAVEEVDNALIGYHTWLDRLDELQAAVADNETAVTLCQSAYESGVGRNADESGLVLFQRLLDSQRELLSNQENAAISEGAAVVSIIQAFRALGGGWDPACASLN